MLREVVTSGEVLETVIADVWFLSGVERSNMTLQMLTSAETLVAAFDITYEWLRDLTCSLASTSSLPGSQFDF